MVGLAMGLGAMGGTVAGFTQPTASTDPFIVLRQAKDLLDQGRITPERFAAKQQEVLRLM